jgi:hypothetical protein
LSGNLKVGDKGPAGGLIFYSTEPARVSSAPAAGDLNTGGNGPAGGVVFYNAQYKEIAPAGKTYQIGDTGPAGGIIFYVNPAADTWKYMEAAPVTFEFKAVWASDNANIAGTRVAVGSGKRNTELISTYLNNAGKDGAAQECVMLSINGFSDWFLPSQGELNLMYLNLKVKSLGGFAADRYWSSSTSDDSYAWYQGFDNGGQDQFYRFNSYRVRAIRQF